MSTEVDISAQDVQSRVDISSTTYDDLPELAEAELLAFANTALSSALAPHRAPSRENGVSPRTWPDFHSTIRRRARAVASHSLVFTARLKRSDNQTENSLTIPIAMMKASFSPTRKRGNRSWTDVLWGDLFYPMLDRLGIGGTIDGLNKEVYEMLFSRFDQERKELLADRAYASVDMFFVHPSYQGHGVGSALLKEIASITDIAGLPLYLEATLDAVPLYKRHGFVKLRDCDYDYKGTKFSFQLMLREPR